MCWPPTYAYRQSMSPPPSACRSIYDALLFRARLFGVIGRRRPRKGVSVSGSLPAGARRAGRPAAGVERSR